MNDDNSPKKVQFLDPSDQSNARSNISSKYRSKTSQYWRPFIDGTKRLIDDEEYRKRDKNNGKLAQSSSLFFKAPTRPINSNRTRRQKMRQKTVIASRKLYKPFTPHMNNVRPMFINNANSSPFYQLPSQNEINKMLASIGAKNLKFGNMNYLQARSRLFDFRKDQKHMIVQNRTQSRRMSQLNVSDII